eukprot:scaffold2737_cov156-Amphora_coffeaeformis.AAC.6
MSRTSCFADVDASMGFALISSEQKNGSSDDSWYYTTSLQEPSDPCFSFHFTNNNITTTMQIVSQFGTHTIGKEDSSDKPKKGPALEVTSMMGTKKIQLPYKNDEIPAPSSVREEDEQIQRAIAASVGASWAPSTGETKEHLVDEAYNGRMGAPLLASKRGKDKEGIFC